MQLGNRLYELSNYTKIIIIPNAMQSLTDDFTTPYLNRSYAGVNLPTKTWNDNHKAKHVTI